MSINLFDYQDLKYKKFNEKLIKTKYEIIGVRIPILSKIAKEILKDNYLEFLDNVNDNYFEEVLLEGLVITGIKDSEIFNKYFSEYIYKIDNWCICDTICNRIKINNKDKYFNDVIKLLSSSEEFIIRVGLILILYNYIDSKYLDKIFNSIDKIKCHKYYVDMGIAWLLCECFIKCNKDTISYLNKNKLNDFTISKTISKIKESYRVDKELKDKINIYKRRRDN